MPELPEVETIRRGLQVSIANKTILAIDIHKPKQVRGNILLFRQKIIGNQIVAVDRIGKLLIFQLRRGDDFLLVHLKMTGQLIYKNKKSIVAGGHNLPVGEDLPNKYSHIIIYFADNSTLFYNDLRQFGYLQIVPSLIKEDIKNKYGLEPLTTEFSWLNFQKVLEKKKGILKSILLDQKIFSGIGNIYADEICFRAGILPSRRVESLSRLERKKIYQACQYIIAKAVEQGGTTFSDYRTTDGARGAYVKYLKVYGRAKKPCQKCKKTIIQKYRLAGRGTHFCSSCQK